MASVFCEWHKRLRLRAGPMTSRPAGRTAKDRAGRPVTFYARAEWKVATAAPSNRNWTLNRRRVRRWLRPPSPRPASGCGRAPSRRGRRRVRTQPENTCIAAHRRIWRRRRVRAQRWAESPPLFLRACCSVQLFAASHSVGDGLSRAVVSLRALCVRRVRGVCGVYFASEQPNSPSVNLYVGICCCFFGQCAWHFVYRTAAAAAPFFSYDGVRADGQAAQTGCVKSRRLPCRMELVLDSSR